MSIGPRTTSIHITWNVAVCDLCSLTFGRTREQAFVFEPSSHFGVTRMAAGAPNEYYVDGFVPESELRAAVVSHGWAIWTDANGYGRVLCPECKESARAAMSREPDPKPVGTGVEPSDVK